MKRRNAGLLGLLLMIISACAAAIPNSEVVDLNSAGNFQYDTPEFFNASVGDRVLFKVNENSLSAESKSILDAQAAWLMQNTNYSAVIEGHADEQGTRAYNLALGARRASAVQAYLVSKGVAESRLRTVTYGKERPVETCSAESCWSQNRRAVTLVSTDGTS